jgi:hypothetical protein
LHATYSLWSPVPLSDPRVPRQMKDPLSVCAGNSFGQSVGSANLRPVIDR